MARANLLIVFWCSVCGTLYLADPPVRIARYYENYYSTDSLAQSAQPESSLKGRFKLGVKKILCQQALKYPSRWSSRILNRFVRLPPYFGFRSLYSLGLDARSKILDVGCGNGFIVEALDWIGFRYVTGCDPHLPRETRFQGGSRLLKMDLVDMEGGWNLIMLHHCFEHVPDPAFTAAQINARLLPGGRCLLRLPNVESVEFARHGGDWWGFHAPRHYYLLSRQGMERVFSNTDLEIERVWCDSEPDHYFYSYEYSLDISDGDSTSVRKQGKPSPRWTQQEIAHIERNVDWYNAQLIGDWIVYLLRKRE